MILVSCVIRAIGQGAAQPAIQASCLDAVGKNRSGVATSTYYLGGDIGQGIGPIVGGFVISAIVGIQGYTVLFVGCAALLLLAGIYFYHAVFQAAAKAPSQ